jgi:Flp pilus assembly protein TadB
MNIIPDSLSSFVRFLIGILLVQGVTVLVIYIALQTDWQVTWPLFTALGAAIGFLAALWFNTIVYAHRSRAVSKITERFSKEREKIRVKAEQQRAKDGRSNERLAAKVRTRPAMGMSLKTGVIVGGTIGLGVTMMVAQFMTLGLITLTAAGGAALGYTVRVRQEKLLTNRRLAHEERTLQAIDVDHATQLLPRQNQKTTDVR